MRTVDSRGRWSDEPDAGPLWGTVYVGPPHVIFGHNANTKPQLHPWATGIDTACVYGGADGRGARREEPCRAARQSGPAIQRPRPAQVLRGKGAPLSR